MREVEPDDAVRLPLELATEVAGAACEVEHERTTGEPELAHRAPPPPHVHPEGHHAVHEVVAAGDRVEQATDGLRLLLALGQRRVRRHPVASSMCSSAVSSSTRRKWCEIELRHRRQAAHRTPRPSAWPRRRRPPPCRGSACARARRRARPRARRARASRCRRRARAPAGPAAAARTRAAEGRSARARCRRRCSDPRRRRRGRAGSPPAPPPGSARPGRRSARRTHRGRAARSRPPTPRAPRPRRPRGRRPRGPARRSPRAGSPPA